MIPIIPPLPLFELVPELGLLWCEPLPLFFPLRNLFGSLRSALDEDEIEFVSWTHKNIGVRMKPLSQSLQIEWDESEHNKQFKTEQEIETFKSSRYIKMPICVL